MRTMCWTVIHFLETPLTHSNAQEQSDIWHRSEHITERTMDATLPPVQSLSPWGITNKVIEMARGPSLSPLHSTLPWHLLLSCQVNDFLCGEEGESGKVARASGVGGLYDSPAAGWSGCRVGMGPACPDSEGQSTQIVPEGLWLSSQQEALCVSQAARFSSCPIWLREQEQVMFLKILWAFSCLSGISFFPSNCWPFHKHLSSWPFDHPDAHSLSIYHARWGWGGGLM